MGGCDLTLLPLARVRPSMTFVRHTLKIADYALTAFLVLFGLIALWMWLQAILYWGDAHAFAQALTFTVITLVIFALSMGAEWAANRGE